MRTLNSFMSWRGVFEKLSDRLALNYESRPSLIVRTDIPPDLKCVDTAVAPVLSSAAQGRARDASLAPAR